MKLSDVMGASPAPASAPMKLSQAMGDPAEPAPTWSERIAQAVGAPSVSPSGQRSAPAAQERLIHGLADPIVGAGQLVMHAPFVPGVGAANELLKGTGHSPAEMADRFVRNRETAYEKARGPNAGADWWRMLGDIANPLNYVAPELKGAGALARIGEAALGGAMGGAMQPVAGQDYWFDKAAQMAAGGVGGAAIGAAAKGAEKAIAPVASATARHLAQSGVAMTPGQLLSGTARRAEEALKSFPILGTFIRGAEGRSIDSFDRAVINQTLEPIGERLPANLSAGHDAIRTAADKIGTEYDRILDGPDMVLRLDPQLAGEIQGIRKLAHNLPPAQAEQFDRILQSQLFHKMGPWSRAELTRPRGPQPVAGDIPPTPSMDGRTLKGVESNIGRLAREYRRSDDFDKQQLGSALDEALRSIRGALGRQHPEASEALSRVNTAFAMLARVEKAARVRRTSEGVFLPADLLSAVKSEDMSRRGRDFAHGDALLQLFAEAGQRVLPGKMPDSGTPERQLWNLLIGGEGGLAAAGHPGALLGTVGTAGALSPLYTAKGGAAAQKYLLSGPSRAARARNIEQAIHALAPGVGVLGGYTLSGQ